MCVTSRIKLTKDSSISSNISVLTDFLDPSWFRSDWTGLDLRAELSTSESNVPADWTAASDRAAAAERRGAEGPIEADVAEESLCLVITHSVSYRYAC